MDNVPLMFTEIKYEKMAEIYYGEVAEWSNALVC